MENALFYTFSTVAQTLAAAIALLGAFALYRLQVIGSSLRDLGVTAMQPYLPDDVARELIAGENYAALIEHLQATQPRNANAANDPYQVATRRRLGQYVQKASSLQRLLKWTLGLTVVVIVAAVVVLALTPKIAAWPGMASKVFVVGIGLFVASLTMYAIFVVLALRDG